MPKRADETNRQPSKFASAEAKKKGFEIALKADFGRGDKVTSLRSVIPSECELATSTSSFGQKYSRLKRKEKTPIWVSFLYGY